MLTHIVSHGFSFRNRAQRGRRRRSLGDAAQMRHGSHVEGARELRLRRQSDAGALSGAAPASSTGAGANGRHRRRDEGSGVLDNLG